MNASLVFVYNAKSDLISKSLDWAHKIISPDTYSCHLCSLTHGNFSEKQVWKEFRSQYDIDFVFMYKDEFVRTYSQVKEYDFPAVFRRNERTDIEVVLDTGKLSDLNSVNELIQVLQKEIELFRNS